MPEKRSPIPKRETERRTSGGVGRARIYQIKVTLSGSRPPIWRRLQVRGDVTLDRLHAILQVLLGWKDRHLHLFASGRTVYRLPVPDLGFPSQDERRVTLAEVLPHEKERLRYEYDFRDGWELVLLVERILPPGTGSAAPLCLAGKRSGPPEESGGIVEYERLVAARQNPPRRTPADSTGRLEEGFDPEAFDVLGVNQELARLR
jgi:hypothetical protein